MLTKLRARSRHNRLMNVANRLVREAGLKSSAEKITPTQVACLAFARHQLRIDEDEAADYLAAALVARGYSTEHRLVTVPTENPMTYDPGPRDAEGWKLHDDGTRVHRYSCTIHDGQGCDGHCGPAPADPVEHLLSGPQESPTRDER
jgi:hypothetical protein